LRDALLRAARSVAAAQSSSGLWALGRKAEGSGVKRKKRAHNALQAAQNNTQREGARPDHGKKQVAQGTTHALHLNARIGIYKDLVGADRNCNCF
jgi:hypothetical protein